VQSERHRLEANYYDYRRLARKLLRGFGPMATATLKPSRWAKPVGASESARKPVPAAAK
jgi:hypothetical protein